MTVSLPTPDGPDTMTSSAPGAPTSVASRAARSAVTGSGPACTEPSEDGLEVGRERRLRPDEAPARRRGQLEPPGVQEEALQPVRPTTARPAAVDGVARDRVPDRGEVDADLVGPAGDEVQLEQRPAVEALPDPVAGGRRAARRRDGH